MHRSNVPYPTLTVIIAISLLGGCRNTYPDSQVSVRPQTNPMASDTQAPRSRLGGKPRSAGDRLAATNQQNPNDSGGASFSFSDAGAPAAQPEKLSSEELAMLEAALAKASPEVREAARKRLAAMSATNPTPATTQARKPSTDETVDEPAPPAVQQASAEGPTDAAAVQQTSATSNSDLTASSTFAMPDLSKPVEKPTVAPAVAETEVPSTSDVDSSEATVQTATPAVEQPVEQAVETPSPAATTETVVTTNSKDTAAEEHADVASLGDQQLMDELIRRYQMRVNETAEPQLSDLLRLRTLLVMSGRPDEAVSEIKGWSAAERDFLNHQMLAMWQLLDEAGHPVRRRRWNAALDAQREATKSLAAATGTLDVRALQFCKEVVGFGQTVPFDTAQFTAGQQVILYSEINNFHAEHLSDGYETHLRGSYQVVDSTGQVIAEQILEDDRQTNSNYRQDYCLSYVLYLPKRLAAGNYRFELTIEDVKGQMYGKASIPLEIKAAQP